MNDLLYRIPVAGLRVTGPTNGPRRLCWWRELLTWHADLDPRINPHQEAYTSHFVFDEDMRKHFLSNFDPETRQYSERGYNGPCWAKWVVLDIDRENLSEALADARKLVSVVVQRYPHLEDVLPVYFSGGKGLHIYVELTHEPPPSAEFNAVAKRYAEDIADQAGIVIDPNVYSKTRLMRLPNSRHPRTGLYKRRIDLDRLFEFGIEAILDLARNPAADGIQTLGDCIPEQQADWDRAACQAEKTGTARQGFQETARSGNPGKAPKYLMEFLRFDVREGERAVTLFKCAAWLTESRAPPPLVHAMLTEPAEDVGLTPSEILKQINAGISHAERGSGKGGTPHE